MKDATSQFSFLMIRLISQFCIFTSLRKLSPDIIIPNRWPVLTLQNWHGLGSLPYSELRTEWLSNKLLCLVDFTKDVWDAEL